MNYYALIRTTVFLLLLSVSGAFDSEGRNFIFLFSRNSEQTLTGNNTRIWVTLINKNTNPVQVALDYPITPDNPATEKRTSQNVVVQGSNYLDVDLPPSLAWDYANSGFQRSYDTRVFVSANASITLLANNQNNVTLQTDTFSVYPREFVSSLSPTYRYAVSVPRPQLSTQFTVFTFIPLTGDFTLTFTTNQGRTYKENLTFLRGSWQYYYGAGSFDAADPVVYVSGDKPFAMMVAVSCVPTSAIGKCDHAAFMPQPLASDYFDPTPVLHDHHVTDLWASQLFYITPPRIDVSTFSIEANVTRNETNIGVQSISINPTITNTYTFPQFEYGDVADIESENCLIQVTRMGGVPFSRRGGAFLTVVPAWSQAIKEPMSFVTRYPGDNLMCFIDSLAYLGILVDGVSIINQPNLDFISIRIDGALIWQFILPIDTPGYHKITFLTISGAFTCYVMGNANVDSSYGYLAAFNRQQVLWLPNVSTTTSTTTTTTTVSTTTSTTTTITATTGTAGSTTTTTGTAGSTTTIASTATPGTAGSTTTTASTATPGTAGSTTTAASTTTTGTVGSTTTLASTATPGTVGSTTTAASTTTTGTVGSTTTGPTFPTITTTSMASVGTTNTGSTGSPTTTSPTTIAGSTASPTIASTTTGPSTASTSTAIPTTSMTSSAPTITTASSATITTLVPTTTMATTVTSVTPLATITSTVATSPTTSPTTTSTAKSTNATTVATTTRTTMSTMTSKPTVSPTTRATTIRSSTVDGRGSGSMLSLSSLALIASLIVLF